MGASPNVVRLLVVIGLVAAALGLLLHLRSSSPGLALRDLPEPERRVLFRQELESFRTLCGDGPRRDALEGRCREKALFLVQFPECDESCEALARGHLAPEGPR
jgi:hypothetical protein